MKNKKYLFQIGFILFLLFSVVNFAKADLGDSQSLYLNRINAKQDTIDLQIWRVNGMSHLSPGKRTSLTDNLTSYKDTNLENLKTTVNNCTTVSCVEDAMNTDWSSPYMVLLNTIDNYSQGHHVAINIQDLYTLINSTQDFINNHTTVMRKDSNALAQALEKLDIFTHFIEEAQAATGDSAHFIENTGYWTCRQYDGTDEKTCVINSNIKGEACYFDKHTGKCLGNDRESVEGALRDNNPAECDDWCVKDRGLKNCYQGNKCAANQLTEEFITATTGQWTCRQYDGTDEKTCVTNSNIKGDPCFFDKKAGKCLGDKEVSVIAATFDKDSVKCDKWCVNDMGLKNCYQGNKCAANQLTEEFITATTGQCGTANRYTFPYGAKDYTKTHYQCESGTSSNTRFPVPGGGEKWVCQADGGDSSTCSARRYASECGDSIVSGTEECDDGDDCIAKGDFCCADCTKQTFSGTSDFAKKSDTLEGYKTGSDGLADYGDDLDNIILHVSGVYNLDKTNSEKLVDLNDYQIDLNTLDSDIDTLSSDITDTVNDVLEGY